MIGAITSLLGSWWRWLGGRTPQPAAAAVPASATPPAEAPAAAPGSPERVRPARSALAGGRPAAETLLALLRSPTLPVAPPPDGTIGPTAAELRARTLAALADLRQIPALQSLAQGFLRALNRPEVSVDEVVATIEKDSALCVRVLRMANSVLVSPERRIEDLDTAVQMLGVARVRKAAQAIFTLRDGNRVAEGFDWRHLWMHALATAAIAEELEKVVRAGDDSQIYLAGLLHDVGKIVLSTVAPDEYRQILVSTWHENGRLEELERAQLGVDHREAGELFARHSGLPPVVIDVIAHHHQPLEATGHRLEVALVAIANHLSKAHGLGFSGAWLGPEEQEFADLPAWNVVAETCGWRPDLEALGPEIDGIVAVVRDDLRSLHEVA